MVDPKNQRGQGRRSVRAAAWISLVKLPPNLADVVDVSCSALGRVCLHLTNTMAMSDRVAWVDRVAESLDLSTQWKTRDSRDYPWEYAAAGTIRGVPVRAFTLISRPEADIIRPGTVPEQ